MPVYNEATPLPNTFVSPDVALNRQAFGVFLRRRAAIQKESRQDAIGQRQAEQDARVAERQKEQFEREQTGREKLAATEHGYALDEIERRKEAEVEAARAKTRVPVWDESAKAYRHLEAADDGSSRVVYTRPAEGETVDYSLTESGLGIVKADAKGHPSAYGWYGRQGATRTEQTTTQQRDAAGNWTEVETEVTVEKTPDGQEVERSRIVKTKPIPPGAPAWMWVQDEKTGKQRRVQGRIAPDGTFEPLTDGKGNPIFTAKPEGLVVGVAEVPWALNGEPVMTVDADGNPTPMYTKRDRFLDPDDPQSVTYGDFYGDPAFAVRAANRVLENAAKRYGKGWTDGRGNVVPGDPERAAELRAQIERNNALLPGLQAMARRGGAGGAPGAPAAPEAPPKPDLKTWGDGQLRDAAKVAAEKAHAGDAEAKQHLREVVAELQRRKGTRP